MDFIALDIETANSESDSVCEIGLVKFRNGLPVEIFSSYVRPSKNLHVDPMNFAIHGISETEIKNAPRLSDLLPKILEFIGSDVVVAHNATQDINKLCATLASDDNLQALQKISFEYVCTLTMSRKSPLLNPISYSLRDLMWEFKLASPDELRNDMIVHTASSDATGAGQILVNLMKLHDSEHVEGLASKLEIRVGQVHEGLLVTRAVGKRKSFWGHKAQLNSEEYLQLCQEIEDSGYLIKDHPLSGKTLVLTVGLEEMTDSDFAICLAMCGAIMKSGVSKKIDFLVEGVSEEYPRGSTAKSIRARELIEAGGQISIIDESSFMQLLGPVVLEQVRVFNEEENQKREEENSNREQEKLEKKISRFREDPEWWLTELNPSYDSVYLSNSLPMEIREELVVGLKGMEVQITEDLFDSTIIVVDEESYWSSDDFKVALSAGFDFTTSKILFELNPKLKRKRGFFG